MHLRVTSTAAVLLVVLLASAGPPARAQQCVPVVNPQVPEEVVIARDDHVALIDGTFAVDVLRNDVTNVPLTVSAVALRPGSTATLAIAAGGQSVTYRYPAAFVPPAVADWFTYTARTPGGKTSTARVDLTSITLDVSFTVTCRQRECDFNVPAEIGGILSYGWDFGEGAGEQVFVTRQVTHRFATSGPKTVTLRTFFGSGHIGRRTQTVDVPTTAPQATWDWDPSGGLKPKFWITSTTFGGARNPDGSLVTYTYYFDPNSNLMRRPVPVANGSVLNQQVELEWPVAGQKFVSLLVVENESRPDLLRVTEFMRVIETVNKPPVANAVAAATATPRQFRFDATAATDEFPIAQYAWDFGDSVTMSATSAPVTHTYARPGTYFATLTVVDNHGEEAQKRLEIAVPDAPPSASFAAHCQGLRCDFDAAATTDDDAVQTIAWTFGDGATAQTQRQVSRTYATRGCFPVVLTVTDSAGQQSTVRVSVSAGDQPLVARSGALVVDGHAADQQSGAPASNLNGILEPGETVLLEPIVQNATGALQNGQGTLTAFSGPAATYAMVKPTATYGPVAAGALTDCWTRGDCFRVSLAAATRPAVHWDATVTEGGTFGSRTHVVHVGRSFSDVPPASPYYPFVESMLHRGASSGCGNGMYCGATALTREQIAPQLLIAQNPAIALPACTTAPFLDVPCTNPFAAFIAELKRREITAGCGNDNYCPSTQVTRGSFAVLLLRTIEGPAYQPPACTTARFTDVPCSDPAAPWIEEMARRGFAAGCTATTYCPGAPVTREQAAVSMTVAFGFAIHTPGCGPGAAPEPAALAAVEE